MTDTWLSENVHELTTLHPAHEDTRDLEPLHDLVRNARVVGIGESTHRVHEFYQLRHRLARFLIDELGFTAFVMESGFPEGRAVDDWLRTGQGDLDDLLHTGITYHMGKCAEMRDQLTWMRGRDVRFYGMDPPDSSATVRPAVEACLSYLDEVDPPYADVVRTTILPLLDYIPADRAGLAWAAPAIHAYVALEPAQRYELTARINDLAERLAAMRVDYPDADFAVQCAVTARHLDGFLAAIANAPERKYRGANLRDLAMADNVEWILEREERLVLVAANGHLQRWPLTVPPFINDGLATLGQHLHQRLGDDYVAIASTYGGGEVWLHRSIPDRPLGYTQPFIGRIGPFDEPNSLDTFLAGAGKPLGMLDLRTIPSHGPVAERFARVDSIMNGPHTQPINPARAFDAAVYIDTVTPWHTVIPRA